MNTVTVSQIKAPSSNLKALQEFHYAPLAAIAGMVAAPVLSEDEIKEKIAKRDAEAADRKAKKAAAKAEAKAKAEAARAKALPPQPRLAVLPNEATVEMLERQRRARAERAEHAARTAPIPAEVLKKGLEADLAEEAKRREEAAAEAKRREEGYKADVHASAMSILFNKNLNLEGKVIAVEEMGFTYSGNHKNGRDGFYFHKESGVEIRVNGGALGESGSERAHKPRGIELLTSDPAKLAERQAANAKLREEGKAKRKASRTVVKTPKADKKSKKDGKDGDKKAKHGGGK
jgi:hypothetical protein